MGRHKCVCVELSRAAPLGGGEQQAKPWLQIFWKKSLQRIHRGMKSCAGLTEAEIKPESTLGGFSGRVPPALQAGGGASALLWEAIMANIFSQESGSNDICHVCTFCLRCA